MGKMGGFGVVVIALAILVSWHTANGDNDDSPNVFKQMRDGLNGGLENMKGGAQIGDLKQQAEHAMNQAKDKLDDAKDQAEKTGHSWGSWFQNKMQDIGLASSATQPPETSESEAPAQSPENAYATGSGYGSERAPAPAPTN